MLAPLHNDAQFSPLVVLDTDTADGWRGQAGTEGGYMIQRDGWMIGDGWMMGQIGR